MAICLGEIMARETKIGWVKNSDGTPGATFNGWLGCTKVSPGCDHCYAETFVVGRQGRKVWGAGVPRHLVVDSTWAQPRKWDTEAKAKGIRIRVFTNSLADVFDAEVDPAWRDKLFSLIEGTPNLDWLVVTKRHKVMTDYLTARWLKRVNNVAANDGPWPIQRPAWPNLWLAVSVENQAMANLRIPALVSMRNLAAVLFLSVEPQLEDINIGGLIAKPGDIDWIITGGESGHGGRARPYHVDWARSLLGQARREGVAFFLKQVGSAPVFGTVAPTLRHPKGEDPAEWPTDLRVQEMPTGT